MNEHAIFLVVPSVAKSPTFFAPLSHQALVLPRKEARWRWRHKATGILRDIISDIRGYTTHYFLYEITHRIHGAAILMVTLIPSIYPSHVSIYTSTMDPMGNTGNTPGIIFPVT